MATGWPMKTTYANGDVYSASDVNDITGTINLLGQSVTTSAGKNAIINGGMDIWQRGTSFTSTGIYTADRWYNGTNSGQTFSRQTTSDTTNLPNIQYCIRAQRNNATSNTNIVGISQSIETVNSIPYASKAVTLSFYARKGANLSGTVTATIYSGTGTDQRRDFGAGFTGEATVATSNPSLTTTWARYTITGTVASTATELAALIYFVPTGTAGAADYIEVTGVQLELGSTATTFSRAGGNIQGELAACQRYYIQNSMGIQDFANGAAVSTTVGRFNFSLPTAMRVTPTSLVTQNLSVQRNSTGAVYSTGTWALPYASTQTIELAYTHGTAVFTAGDTLIAYGNNANSYYGVSAEL